MLYLARLTTLHVPAFILPHYTIVMYSLGFLINCAFLSDEGSSLKTLDLAFRISAIHQPFIFRFVCQHCMPYTRTERFLLYA